ncbi:MAG: hypothetical protein WCI92_16805 [Bacteroidota bacterium]
MRKTYLSESQINELVQKGNSILTAEEYSKLYSIGKKYNIELVHGKMANLQLWVSVIRSKMFALPKQDDFRMAMEKEGKWYAGHSNGEIVLRYMKHMGIWDSEYVFLNSPKFDYLQVFTSETIQKYRLDTQGEENIFVKNGGDYFRILSRYDKSHCDKTTLDFSAHLQSTLDSLFHGMSENEKINVGQMALNYASTSMNSDQFHNTLYSEQ